MLCLFVGRLYSNSAVQVCSSSDKVTALPWEPALFWCKTWVVTCCRALWMSMPWPQGAGGLARHSPAFPLREISMRWFLRFWKAVAMTVTPSYVSAPVYLDVPQTRSKWKGEKDKIIYSQPLAFTCLAEKISIEGHQHTLVCFVGSLSRLNSPLKCINQAWSKWKFKVFSAGQTPF